MAHRDFDKALVKYRGGKSGDDTKNEAGQIELKESVPQRRNVGVLLAALPLKEGFKATFPTLSEDRDELDWITRYGGQAGAQGCGSRQPGDGLAD